MEPEDFDIVTKQLVFSQFSMPCGSHGDLDKALKAVQGFQGVLEVKKDQRAFLLSTVKRLATDSSLVVGYDSMQEVQALGQKCQDGVRTLSQEISDKLAGTCSPSGALDQLIARMREEGDQQALKDLADTLTLALRDHDFLLNLLATAGGDPSATPCAAKLREIQGSRFRVPFDFLVYTNMMTEEATEEEPHVVPQPDGQ